MPHAVENAAFEIRLLAAEKSETVEQREEPAHV